MERSMRLALLIIISFASIFFAANAEIIEPLSMNITEGSIINLGKIGPGQTIDIVANGVATGARFGIEGRWQILRVVSVPDGWQGFDSKELALSMKAGVKASNDTKDGEYRVTFRLEEDPNQQQGLGSITFQVVVTVSRDIIAATFPNERVETGVGQPARYPITLKSTSAANDVFEISAENVPSWDYRKSVHVPAGGTVNTFYEIVSNEEKEYSPVIVIKSQSSDEVKISKELSLAVKSDVIGDLRAANNGVLIFPMALEPLYSLLGIIDSIMGV